MPDQPIHEREAAHQETASRLLQSINTKDNRWVLVAAPYPSQQKKLSRLLNAGWLPDQMANAIRQWDPPVPTSPETLLS